MPAPAIKICGVTGHADLDTLIAARVDYVGLNFIPRSPRHVTLDMAAALGARAQGRISRVGLFLDADDAEIGAGIAAAGLDAVQLHGSESPERCAQVRARFGRPVWKALPVATHADLDRVATYTGGADLLLLDAKTPPGSLPGGSGLSFDWTLLAGWRAPLPWALAGGLNPDNVAQAVRLTSAPLVDAASGVESAPGIKDAGKIAAFCAAARGA